MRVLSVSHDKVVLDTRNQILRVNGYEVVATMDTAEALRLFGEQQFDAAVLGDSIELDERVALASQMNALRPEMPVAFLYRTGEMIPSHLHVVTIENLDPELLLNRLKAAILRTASSAGQ